MRLPARVRASRLHVLGAGIRIHRIHAGRFGPCDFNPCLGRSARFTPVLAPDDGHCVPSLYAATSLDAAAYETVFRDAAPSARKSVPRQRLDGLTASVLEVRSALSLVPLWRPELIAWGLDVAEFFDLAGAHHPCCRKLAALAWRDNPKAHGMIWRSVRDDSALALLLFGDRAEAGNLAVDSTACIARNLDMLSRIRAIGRRAGIVIGR